MIINITLDYDLDSNEDPGAVVRALFPGRYREWEDL